MGRDRMGEPPRFLTSLGRPRGQPRAPRAGRAPAGSYRPITWSLAATLVAAVGVQVMRTGLDVLVILIVCAIVIVVERTLGDWTAETIGPSLSAAGIMALAGTGIWLVSANGKVDQFFAAADAAGYGTLFRASSAAAALSPAPAPAAVPATSRTHSSPPPIPRSPTTSAISTYFGLNGSRDTALTETTSERDNRGRTGPSRRLATLTIRIELPRVIRAGESALIRAHVSAAGVPVPGAPAVFAINGRSGSATVTDEKGTASVLLMPKRGRRYEIYVRVAGSREFRESSASRSVSVAQ